MKLTAVAVALAIAWPAAARAADPLAEARAAQARVDYDGALAALDRALGKGGLARGASREALLLRGEILAALGRGDDATASFVDALAIDPAASLPEGISPRARAAFDDAKGRGPKVVRVTCRLEEGVLNVALDAGTSTRARRVQVERREANTVAVARDQVTPPSAQLVAPATRAIACFAIDDAGNVMASGPGWDAPLRPQGARTTTTAPAVAPISRTTQLRPPQDAPLYRSPWLWGGAAAVTGAGAITLSILVARDQAKLDDLIESSSAHDFSEAETVRSRGERRASWANFLWVATGVFAAAAGACALWPYAEPDGVGVAGQF